MSHQATHPPALQAAAPRVPLSAGATESVREGAGQLDLRPPETMTVAEARAKVSGLSLRDLDEGSYQGRVAAVTGMHLPMHESSPFQEFGQRVGREGVPFARLFESRSALLSLGLSPRGKPGLWLIQKTH